MIKVFEADQKRLRSIIQSYEEKKPDLQEREKKERLEVIQMAKDCFTLFKMDFNDQTTKFEKGLLTDASAFGADQSVRLESQTNVSRMAMYNENETISQFIDDPLHVRAKKIE